MPTRFPLPLPTMSYWACQSYPEFPPSSLLADLWNTMFGTDNFWINFPQECKHCGTFNIANDLRPNMAALSCGVWGGTACFLTVEHGEVFGKPLSYTLLFFSPDFNYNTDGYEGDTAEDRKSQDGSETMPFIDESPTMSPHLCAQGQDGEAVSPTPPEGVWLHV